MTQTGLTELNKYTPTFLVSISKKKKKKVIKKHLANDKLFY